ncbi:MAG: tetratricopeptide repeat protein, partial [Candidatus Omnitrophica bacterium]|nr:tetratricopeptide repeat protein [Candidatus Omnitrophota bacterium]
MLDWNSLLRKITFLLFLLILTVVLVLCYYFFILNEDISKYYFVLNKIEHIKDIEEGRQLEPLIKRLILDELTQKEIDHLSLLKLHTALDIFNLLEDKMQFEDIKLFLKDVLAIKEQKKAKLIISLDRFILRVIGPKFKKGLSLSKYKKKEAELLEKISSTIQVIQIQQQLYELASIYINADQISKAINLFRKVIELDPQSRYALNAEYILGTLYKLEKNFDYAIKIFERLSFQNNELSLYSRYLLASIYEHKDDFLKAKEIYE